MIRLLRLQPKWALAVLLAAVACAAACSSSPANPAKDAAPPELGSRATEQQMGACPSPPRILIGVKPPGASCANAGDCKPVCCACGDAGARRYLAAACEGATNACADDVATCVTTVSTVVCP